MAQEVDYSFNRLSQDTLPRNMEGYHLQDLPDQPPPPYSSIVLATGVIQGAEGFDAWKEYEDKERARLKSTPIEQYRSQINREYERIQHQRMCRHARKQTLPFDARLDDWANAKNNVQSRWVEQGIWAENWGLCLRAGYGYSKSNSPRNGYSCRAYSPKKAEYKPGTRWAHEIMPYDEYLERLLAEQVRETA